MTSAAVISSNVARINCLKKLPDGTDHLVRVLNEIKESLLDAGDYEDPQLEKDMVRLSYDVVDAIEDAAKNKRRVARKATTKLQELQGKLNGLHLMYKEKSNTNPESTSDLENLEKNEESARMEDIYSYIRETSSSVVYLVGESGMGKSTLARKLVRYLSDELPFDICTWVPVNHNFQLKRVLRVLLQQVAPHQEVGRYTNETELIAQIFAVLKSKTYLLVLDDITTIDDWLSIRPALPIPGSTRVIITSSSREIISTAPPSEVHQIPKMSQHGILKLLEMEASCTPGSLEVGQAIFSISGGSPLLAKILGKSLQSESANGRQQQLVDELHSYLPHTGTPQVLGACYKRLAPETRTCLLYLAQFPRGEFVEFEKLHLLLEAENLLFSAKECPRKSLSPRQSLFNHMEVLADKMLVEVREDALSSRSNKKSYRLHDQVRQFCKLKGLEEEFTEILDMKNPQPVGLHTHRLAIHLSKNKDNNSIRFNSKETLKKILSLLILNTSESGDQAKWPAEINELKEFTHLRILNCYGMDFRMNLPIGIDKLVFLQFLSFRGCWLEELPSCLSNLTQLETLDLLVHADCKMMIPAHTITNMKRMIHLYLPRLYCSTGKTKLQLQSSRNLETLVNFNTEVFDARALSYLYDLKFISTISNGDPKGLNDVINFINNREHHLHLSSVEVRNFDCYDKARVLAVEKLLRCKFVDSIHIQGQIGELPKEDNRAGRVADIVLDYSGFEDDPMNYLGMFQNLQSLVMTNDAYAGTEIVIAAAPLFLNLRSLKLQNLRYLENLTIEKGALPNLLIMQIHNCNSLRVLRIPKELVDRLRKEQESNTVDAFSIFPFPREMRFYCDTTPSEEENLEGTAAAWFRWAKMNNIWCSWPTFLDCVMQRFGTTH